MVCHKFVEKYGLDLDDLLAYNTVKMVKVRDFRLGALFYLFQLAILLYIIVYAIIIRQGYLALEQIQAGSITLNSRKPSGDFETPQSELTYCQTYECLYWDEALTEYPVGKDYSIVVASRVNITTKTAPAGCILNQWGPECSYTGPEGAAQYVARSEEFTIRVRHGVRGINIKREGTNIGSALELDSPLLMKGRMKNANTGDIVREWPSEDKYGVDQGETRGGDIIQVSEFLDAAGVDFNDALRFDGLNILVYIVYDMTGTSSLRYTYEPRTLAKTEYKIVQKEIQNNGNSVQEISRHGIRIIFIQTGVIGQFDFLSLMVTLVTALALLAVATTITDNVMMRLTSYRQLYISHKVEVTEDFSIWRNMSESDRKHRLELAKRINAEGHEVVEDELGISVPEATLTDGIQVSQVSHA